MAQTYSVWYLEGIKEGREWVKKYGSDMIQEHLENTFEMCRKFDAQNPVGQMCRGERDFLKNYIKKNGQERALKWLSTSQSLKKLSSSNASR